ncbi:MAG TPA: hypothetical protein VKQ30_08295 [Ktedonobacterales bacterium]|nr:hypothetical protein [Ktedonobacterales bacterium]
MCSLSQPAPSLLLGLPPNSTPFIMLVFALVLIVPPALTLNYGRNSGKLGEVIRRPGFRLAAVAYVLLVVAEFLIDFLVLPTDGALQDWSNNEYLLFLSRHCSTATVTMALQQAQSPSSVLRVVAVVLLGAGLVLLALGFIYRNVAPKSR